jgi:heme exporter protein CcmD
MGGYARFVWPSYAIAFAAVFLNIWWALRAAKDARTLARRRVAMAASAGADSGATGAATSAGASSTGRAA